MGDGAVVCMPSQQQPIAERFPVSEASWGGRVFGCAPEKKMKETQNTEQHEDPDDAPAKEEELENGEFVPESKREQEQETNGELENGEFVPEMGLTGELEMGEFVPDEWERLEDKLEHATGSGRMSEFERGEIVPDKGRRGDRQNSQDDHYRRKDSEHGNWEKGDFGRGRRQRGDRRGRTPDNHHRRREGRSRIDSEPRKRSSLNCESVNNDVKHENSNGKHHGRDSSTRSQRKPSTESESSSRKHHGEFSGNSASKTRRISEENSCRSGHQDKSHSSSTISTRNSSSSRYSSSRRSPLPSRAHDRHARHVRSDRSPGSSEKSPHSRTRHRDHRQRTPSRRDRSPHDRARSHDLRNRTAPINSERSPLNSEKHQGRSSRRDISARESSRSSRSVKSDKEKSLQLPPPPPPPSPPPLPPPPPANGFLEDHHHHHHHHHHHSMEEDMDISDTPPHHPNTLEQSSGKWYYLDEFGLERGPSKLDDLKRLVEGGVLPSDHLIKHLDSNRWVTVENAASPSVPVNLTSIVSDAVTQMVCPPEAPGNMSTDAADAVQEDLDHLESPEDFHIDERVEALLDGIEIIPGREVEIIGEALKATFEHIEWENFDHSEGFTRCRSYAFEIPRPPEGFSRDGFAPNLDKDPSILSSDSTDLFAGRWSCKGGDWRRNDDNAIDRCQKRKLVLNEGFPLCQMPKSGEDPRRHGKDELYISSSDKKLDLPTWAFSWNDDKNESNGRVSQTKIPAARGVKGIMLPVLRINACVARESIFSPEPQQTKAKPIERQHRSSRPHNTGSEKNSRTDVASSHSKKAAQSDNRSSIVEVENIKIHKNRTHTIDELSVNTGGWYYLDGAGHEHGPALFSELQDLVAKGAIISNSSVFRKTDNIWVPVTVGERASKGRCAQDERRSKASRSTPPFNSLYPQYVGYMRGKLHELVMRSYKSREFAVAIHEVLDPWISAKQPKKELEKHFPFNSSISKSSAVLSRDAPSERFWSNTDGDGSGSYGHVGKRARLLLDESDEDLEQDVPSSFEELWGEQVADEQTISMRCSEKSWGLLSSPILARIFHFLRADVKSFHVSSATCKHWRATAQSYKNVSRHIDLSSLGPSCTDSMLQSIMRGCDKRNVSSLTLSKCTNVSAPALEEILQSFTSIASIDIRGCNQFKELTTSFQNVKWIRSRSFQNMKILEESSSKTRSLRWITDKSLKEMGGDGGELTGSRDSAVPTFRQGYYKRTRLPDARKSTSALTRHAQLRQLLRKKSVTAYKKMEEFIGIRLKEIMKGNTFECFVPRVAEIEDRIRNGYYARRGLSCVKEDISRMCRDALKAKKKGDSGEMRHAIMLFFQLAKRLEDSKASHKKVESSSRSSKERLESGLSEGSRHKKKSSHKKGASRGSRSTNGGPDVDSAAVDQEVRRSVPKASRRHVDSGSETSEENDRFTECDTVSDSDGRTSDTESELDSQLEGSRTEDGRESTVTWDDSLDDREWGARMTKASLVPPVTRKYEVIDQYLVVADEEEVKRKMAVALPEDYEEKLRAQKSGLDETDMQIPEVKEYKPRKTLGDEVIEQEVYGIDPYTHNLLLDSMPEEADWPLVEKQNFIEEVLLRVLNKQTRHLTGSGNTPMVYHLKPVVEEIKRTAEGGDSRLVKLSNAILKAMQSRPDDNYVAYRKGLGVVCNKEGGFGDDDFVVEFLGEVYPAWKWFEKQDGIRSLQKNNKDPAPEFYNIYLERPKGDRDGYDLVVVDAMHKANYASRICHSCRPNCEAKVTAVDGQYQIGIYAVRPIAYGEEITFDYNSVTESKEEYEASVCLCGSQVCRGSYLNLTGEDAFHNVLKECHGLLDRHRLMLEACEAGFVSQEDYVDLGRAGLGTCLLDGLPDWLIAYSARLVRFMNFERTKLPEEILKHNVEEKKKFFTDVCIETEKIEAENQAEGVYNQRLQNLALTLDKVRYVMRCAFGDPKRAPPPLERLSPEELVAAIWTAEDSLVDELLRCLASHLQAPAMDELRSKVRARAPSGPDLPSELKKSLLWLRDELRTIPCTQRCRVDAAADLIHLYAYTKCFFRVREYKAVESPPVYISPLDLGPKYVEKMGAGFQEYCKRYGENYCLGQLIFWHNQTSAEPDAALARARRGCLALPDLSSSFPPDFPPPLYGPRTLRFVLSRMEKQPQRPWPKDQIWQFRSSPRLLGTPMLDAVLAGGGQPLDRDMIHWLRSRPSLFDLA